MQAVQDMKTKMFWTLKEHTGLKPLCPKYASDIVCDFLAKDDALKLPAVLKSNGFECGKAAVFLAEGLIMYLGMGSDFQFLDDVSDPTEPKFQFLEDVSIVAASGSILILNFIDHTGSSLDGHEMAKRSGLSEPQLREGLGAKGWKDIEFFNWGMDSLNYGRYPEKFKPSKQWSFVVARKG